MEYFHRRPSQSLTATENKQYKDSIVVQWAVLAKEYGWWWWWGVCGGVKTPKKDYVKNSP